ncbi:MAG: SCO family protein [Acidimicrobiales bacterium]
MAAEDRNKKTDGMPDSAPATPAGTVSTDSRGSSGHMATPDQEDANESSDTGESSGDAARASSSPVRTPPIIRSSWLFPRRYAYYVAYGVLGLLIVITVGFFLLNRFGPTTQPSTSAGTFPPAANGAPKGSVAPASASQLSSPLKDFMALSTLKGLQATGFTLTDAATGAQVSLSSLSGHVVVLTFANAACNDICPVLATELHQAAALLGTTSVPVTFLTINSDPLDTSTIRVPILGQRQFATLANWRFLTGSIPQLNPVWKAYGVSIDVDDTTHDVVHDNPVYFISTNGRLEWTASLFGDETASGHFTLPAKLVTRFAQGLAHYAGKLAREQ